VPGIAGGGRHPGRGSGLRLDDIAPDGGHRILAAHPAGQAARVPSRPLAVTLTVIPPAAPPRYAQAARAQSPPALALRLRHHGHEPEREAPVRNRRPGSVADHRPATAAAGDWPPGGVAARDGGAPSLAGSHSGGPARVCCRRGGSRDYRLRPVSSGESIITAAQAPRKTLPPAISCFSAIHEESTKSRQLSAFHSGYPRLYSQPAHRLPDISRRIPEPLSSHAIGRSFHSDFRVVTGNRIQCGHRWLTIRLCGRRA
jgi:hypothetical protein